MHPRLGSHPLAQTRSIVEERSHFSRGRSDHREDDQLAVSLVFGWHFSFRFIDTHVSRSGSDRQSWISSFSSRICYRGNEKFHMSNGLLAAHGCDHD